MDTALLEHTLDLFRSDQRPRRIVHSNIFRFAINPIQTGSNRILPAFTADVTSGFSLLVKLDYGSLL